MSEVDTLYFVNPFQSIHNPTVFLTESLKWPSFGFVRRFYWVVDRLVPLQIGLIQKVINKIIISLYKLLQHPNNE